MAARTLHKPSSSTSRCAYHVFLSFRGEDTRKNFTDHLYEALKRAGFHTFRDDDGIGRGEDIELEIQKAIKESKISIIVFSKDYASSRWCLDELLVIMECRKTAGHFVLPIFYDVDPSQVSEQTLSYAEAFAVHEEVFKEEIHRVNWWRAALREVADLGGMVLQDGYEAHFIQDIVKEVRKKINSRPLHVCSYLVGVDSLINNINSLLQDVSTDVDIAIIYGIGGVGKTTIAKTVYNQNFDKFEAASFLANVRETSEQPNGFMVLQRKLLSDILKEKTNKIYNVDEGIIQIKDAICCRRVMIVLDDVDKPDQFNAIIGMRDWIYQGSKIIVTTRRKSLLQIHEACVKFEVEPLKENKSLQLFCWHAFRQAHPVEGYIEHSKRLVHYCGGVPLALEVLGSSLSRNLDLWKIALQEPEAIDDDCKIQKILRISYDSLQDDRDKSLFLDIACFFIGKEKDLLEKIVEDCYLYRKGGIQRLIDQCLVTIDEDNTLMMHQLLRDVGREVVRQESPENLGERSRLWHHEDVLTVLKHRTGSDKVKSLALNICSLTEDKCNRATVSGIHANPCNNETSTDNSMVCDKGSHPDKTNSFLFPCVMNLKAEAFRVMRNLKFLQLNYVPLNGSYKKLPKSLIWLEWIGFPLKSIPQHLCLEKLVVLNICSSNVINVWEGRKCLQFLKILDLSHSHSLVRTPDFSGVTRLERLILEECINLVDVHESIGDLERLLFLNLRHCTSLRMLPTTILKLKSLQEVNFSGCSNLILSPEELERTESLRSHGIDRPATLSLLPPSKGPKSITFSFSALPCSLVQLSLEYCNITDDTILKDLGSLPLLEKLYLSGNPITSIPESISSLTMLVGLFLNDCQELQSLPELPTVMMLSVEKCNSLQRISNIPTGLVIGGCDKLIEVQEWITAELLRNFDVWTFFIMSKFFGGTARKFTRTEIIVDERGVFSIILQGSEVLSWFSHPSESFPLSFTVPPLVYCGLNLCVLYSLGSGSILNDMSMAAKFSNETKGLTFLVKCPTILNPQGDDDMVWFSYWKSADLFESGDRLKISVIPLNPEAKIQVKKCTVHMMRREEEKDSQSNNEETLLFKSLSQYFMHMTQVSQMLSTFFSDYRCTYRMHYPNITVCYGFDQV